MRTSKPISTISYNTEKFLKSKLEELIRNHTISDWMFIKHNKEGDDKKDHIHLWISPNKMLDTMSIQDFLKELDPQKPDKPLKCTDFRPSSIDDWILYALHWEPYLRKKMEKREYHYTPDDIKRHDDDTFEENLQHALKGSTFAKEQQILESIKRNQYEGLNMILDGSVPIQMASQIRALQQLAFEAALHQKDEDNKATRRTYPIDEEEETEKEERGTE